MKHDSMIHILGEAIKGIIQTELDKGTPEKEIMEKLDAIDTDELTFELFEIYASTGMKYLESTMYEQVINAKYISDEFISRQNQKWGDAFIAYEAMYIIAVEAAESYGDYLEERRKSEDLTDKKYSYMVLRELHGRACQVYLEILCLMQNGFADGALARWRSMYEISVVSCFIRENGEKVAKEFYKAANTEDRYDWAKVSDCFQSPKYQSKKYYISFSDMVKNTHFISNIIWKQRYDLGNKVVHASPQGTFGRIGSLNQLRVTPVGRSDYGVHIPAEQAAISLALISTDFLQLFPYEDGIVAMKYLSDWVDIIRNRFNRAHEECFSDPEFEPIIY